MAALARREHSRSELNRKLVGRGHDEQAVTAVLDDLAARNLLSEARFVEAFVRSRVERGQGPVRIAHELRQRGVPAELAGPALAAEELDWVAQARTVLARKFSGPATDMPERARRQRFLEYRGYTQAQIIAACRGAIDD